MSEHFSYTRSWDDIENMLYKAERKQNAHLLALNDEALTKKQKIKHMRDFKGLQGVIYALRWTLGDNKMSTGKVLGVE
mgnify:CR=1 FL=1